MPASSSLYRKYRSQTFDELVGQEPVVRTLKNAIASNLVSHAYLFTGPRGVGKTSAARLLARAANCTTAKGDKPCNKCPNCLAATRDIATDLIEIDAASNTGVDNIREVIERANFAPSVWNTKFYIIDEVHMLSTSAFNALLKTLEEPPAHTSFILATTEVHKVPATVASRCQRFDFRRVPLRAMIDRLQWICEQEGIKAEPAALELVARQATGSLRDALSLLDQLRVFADKEITLPSVRDMLGAGGSDEVAAFIDTLMEKDLAAGLRRINGILEEGLDLRQFNRQIVEHLRGLMLVKSGAASVEGSLLDVTDEMKSHLQMQAERVTMDELLSWARLFGEADTALRSTIYGQLPLEMAFLAAALPPQEAVRDHSAELAAGVEDIAVPPSRQRPAPSQPEKRVQVSQPPPPPIHSDLGGMIMGDRSQVPSPKSQVPGIHSELDSMAMGNGKGHSAEVLAEGPSLEEQPPVDESATIADVPMAAPPADSSGELAQLQSKWPDLVDQINARSKQMASIYRNPDMVKPVQISSGVCTISFRDPIYAKKSMSNSPDAPYRNIVEGALSRVLGYKCRIECVTFAQAEAGILASDETPPDKGKGRNTAREKPSPYETTRGKAAMNIFDIEKFEDPQ